MRPGKLRTLLLLTGAYLGLLEWLIFYRKRRPWLPPHARR